MEKERLIYLIDQYRTGKASDNELQELEDWYRQIDYGTQDLESWINMQGDYHGFVDIFYSNFQHRLTAQQRSVRVKKIYRLTAVAASLLLVASLALFLNRPSTKQPAREKESTLIVPGKGQAVLTLANGQKIILTTQKNGIIHTQNGVSVLKNNQEQIVYADSGQQAANSNAPLVYNSIETPRGGQYQIRLPDGTVVWLNAASKLTYPIRFSHTERRVQLSGEAYFEVANNTQLPFKVITGNQEIAVLGTHFNVYAYADESAIKTTLLEGSVQINNVQTRQHRLLTPGQQAAMDPKTGSINVNRVNTQQVISWKNGYFLFDNMNIQQIMRVISRWYDVDVVYGNVDVKETFGGSFSRNAELSEILQNLQLLSQDKVHFRIEHRKIMINH